MLIRMNKSKYHNEFNIVLDFVDQLLEYSVQHAQFVEKHFLAHFNAGKTNRSGLMVSI